MYIDKFKKIVIKIGSSTIVDKSGKAKKIWLKKFAKSIKNFIKKNKQIVIVSSGAIAMGCGYLKIKKEIFIISALKQEGLKTLKGKLLTYVY